MAVDTGRSALVDAAISEVTRARTSQLTARSLAERKRREYERALVAAHDAGVSYGVLAKAVGLAKPTIVATIARARRDVGTGRPGVVDTPT